MSYLKHINTYLIIELQILYMLIAMGMNIFIKIAGKMNGRN